jgi:hypothetical protein
VIAIENARLLNELRQRTDDLSEALEQQTATSEVLGVISSSSGELAPVFQAMLANAVRICGAGFGTMYLAEGSAVRVVAMHNAPPAYAEMRRRRREIIVPASASAQDLRPIRAETRATLVAAIVRGRRWLDEIVAGTVTSVEQIAAREKCSIRHVNMTISLAFLAPSLVKAATEGRLPRGIGVTRLRDAPAEWSRQYAMLGLSNS